MKFAVFIAPVDYEHEYEHRFAEHASEEREKPEITPCLASLNGSAFNRKAQTRSPSLQECLPAAPHVLRRGVSMQWR